MICTTRHCTYQSYKVSSKSDQGFLRNRADKLKVDGRTQLTKTKYLTSILYWGDIIISRILFRCQHFLLYWQQVNASSECHVNWSREISCELVTWRRASFETIRQFPFVELVRCCDWNCTHNTCTQHEWLATQVSGSRPTLLLPSPVCLYMFYDFSINYWVLRVW